MVGAHELPFHIQAFDQVESCGFIGDEAVGAFFHKEAIFLNGGKGTAGLLTPVENVQLKRDVLFFGKFQQSMGAGETANTRSDHSDPKRCHASDSSTKEAN